MANLAIELSGDCNGAEIVLVIQPHHRRNRDIHSVKLIVPGSRLNHPTATTNNPDNLESLPHKRDLLTHRVGGAKKFLTQTAPAQLRLLTIFSSLSL